MNLLERPEIRLAIALGIGLLIGAERERRKAEKAPGATAGIRTFALVAFLGGALAWLDHIALIVMGGAFVGAAALVGYARGPEEERGLTSEVALVVAYVLGVLASVEPALASGAAVTVTLILALRSRIHALVREALSAEELLDALLFGISALVVLPLVPDEPIGPYGVVNPFAVWRFAVLMMAITAAGYVAQRLAGPRYGLPLAGLASGFVSSSATIASMGARAREDGEVLHAAVAGAACSTISTVIQLALVVGAANPSALAALAPSLCAAGVVATAYGLIFAWHATRAAPTAVRPKGRAFRMRDALLFAVMVSAVTLIATAVHRSLGATGLLVATGFAGLVDTHSAAASVASVAASRAIDMGEAVLGVLVAMTTNSITKIAMAFASGSRPFARRVAVGVVLVILAAWSAFAWTVVSARS